MAPPMWEVKETEGKGKGVFATQDIDPGTVIMVDNAAITVRLSSPPGAIDQAVSDLGPEERADFFALHDGGRTESSKALRIFRANFFDNDGTGFLFLRASRVNHSCAPNASMHATWTGRVEDGISFARQQVAASKTIKSGEEICITYRVWYESLPSWHRRAVTLQHYGFVRTCECCMLGPSQLLLSDTLRRIIGALNRALRGHKPGYYQSLEGAEELFSQELPSERDDPLDEPLSTQQRLAYAFLLAAARDAEGLNTDDVVSAHELAAGLLFCQIVEMEDIVVLQSVDLLWSWLRRASLLADTIDPKNRFVSASIAATWGDRMDDFPNFQIGTKFVGIPRVMKPCAP